MRYVYDICLNNAYDRFNYKSKFLGIANPLSGIINIRCLYSKKYFDYADIIIKESDGFLYSYSYEECKGVVGVYEDRIVRWNELDLFLYNSLDYQTKCLAHCSCDAPFVDIDDNLMVHSSFEFGSIWHVLEEVIDNRCNYIGALRISGDILNLYVRNFNGVFSYIFKVNNSDALSLLTNRRYSNVLY